MVSSSTYKKSGGGRRREYIAYLPVPAAVITVLHRLSGWQSQTAQADLQVSAVGGLRTAQGTVRFLRRR